VLRVTPGGVAVAAAVPVDSEDLAAGDDGALALFSPLRGRVLVYGAGGEPAGELAVPRVLRHVRGLSLGRSRRVLIHDEHQETLALGSPAAPATLAQSLHGRREGAAFLADDTGLAVVRLADGRPELRLQSGKRVRARHQLAERVLAARIVGVAGGAVCLLLERLAAERPALGSSHRRRCCGKTELAVERRAVCLEAASGARLVELDLPAPGLYLPRRELAVGGGAERPVLAFIHPRPDGLRVRALAIPR
jgi:hypothetical protein